MQRLLKILAWVIWCAVIGVFLGMMVLRSYVSMGATDEDPALLLRTVFLRGALFGGLVGLMFGTAASFVRKKTKPNPPTEPAPGEEN